MEHRSAPAERAGRAKLALRAYRKGAPLTPAPVALLAAIVGGLATAAVLLLGVLSLVGGTTRPEMLALAGPVVILPAGLVALAAGLYAGRRLWATLRPDAAETPSQPDDESP